MDSYGIEWIQPFKLCVQNLHGGRLSTLSGTAAWLRGLATFDCRRTATSKFSRRAATAEVSLRTAAGRASCRAATAEVPLRAAAGGTSRCTATGRASRRGGNSETLGRSKLLVTTRNEKEYQIFITSNCYK